MSDDNSTNVRLTADISDFDAKMAAVEKRLDEIYGKASSIPFGVAGGASGRGGRSTGAGGSTGGNQAFRESVQGGGRGNGGFGGFNPFSEDDGDNGFGLDRNPVRFGRGGLGRGFNNAGNQMLDGLPVEGAMAVGIAAKVMTDFTQAQVEQQRIVMESESHQMARRMAGQYTNPAIEAGESRSTEIKSVNAYNRRIAGLAGPLGEMAYDSAYGFQMDEFSQLAEARGKSQAERMRLAAYTGVSNLELSHQDPGLLQLQLGGAQALEEFGTGAARQFGRSPDGRYAGMAAAYGIEGINRGIGQIARQGMAPMQADLRERLMRGEDVRDLAPMVADHAAASGDLAGLAQLRPFLSEAQYNMKVRLAGGMLDSRGERDLLGMARGEAESSLRTADYTGGRTTAGFDRIQQIDEAIANRLQQEIEQIKNLPGSGPVVAAARAALAATGERIQQDIGARAHYGDTMTGLQNQVQAGNTSVQSARTNLWGQAGDYTGSVLPMQQADLNREMARQQNIVSSPGFTAQEKMQAQIALHSLQAQAMFLPAQAQQQDIGRAESNYGAQRAEQGVSAAYASLYGNSDDIGAVGQSRQGQIASERQYWQNLNPQSVQQANERRQRLAGLDAESLQVRAGTQSAQIGIEREQQGLRMGNYGYDIAQATAYGTDVDVATAYQGQRMERQSDIATLTARANDASLPREVRMQAQRDLINQRQGLMDDSIRGRDVGIHREETRAQLRQGDAGFALDRARQLGGASDFRSAVGGQLAEFGVESGEIDAQLAQGGLTFDQQSRLRGRQQNLRRESFALSQRSIDEGYQREDLESYDLERMHRQGSLRRSQMLPFGMGNGLAQEMGMIGFNNQRLGSLSQRERDLYQSGNLSPERRMGIEREMEGLQSENTEYLGHMASGMENYLPAMSAGAPSSFGRYNSLNLAALRMGQAGSLAGNFGYAGGGHEQMQQGMLRNLMGNPSTANGAGMNSPISREAGMAGVGELTQAINNLAAIMTRGGGMGGGQRPGEIMGQLHGTLEKMINPGQGKGAQFGR